jgi:hypothetical protein
MDAHSYSTIRPGNGNGAIQANGAARSVQIIVNGRIIDLDAVARMSPADLAILVADFKKSGWLALLARFWTGRLSPTSPPRAD